MARSSTDTKISCFHCGEKCHKDTISYDNKEFCCNGCRAVYELLSQSNLGSYYTLESAPGTSPPPVEREDRFSYLDDSTIRLRILEFSDGKTARVTFSMPQIHCASCIWLLENLHRLNSEINSSRVTFLEKRVSISYNENAFKLSELVSLLSTIGYEPDIKLDLLDRQEYQQSGKKLFRKVGVAGFCFGNIMLFSLPEYFATGEAFTQSYRLFFAWLTVALSLPVMFYSGVDYFRSAWYGLAQKTINMDVPISLGLTMLFSRSLYEIFILGQAGYMDSLSGLVFFLLLGKVFQQKSYDNLSFARDYKSLFPLSVRVKRSQKTEVIPLTRLNFSDRLLVRNQELIPCDSILISKKATIDYAFVTGEAEPVEISIGDRVYAGGRQVGETIELEVVKDVSQSYLTRLWNENELANSIESDDSDTIPENATIVNLSNQVSKYFTTAVILISFIAGVYWWGESVSIAINAATAVLIVACPCALALSTPFTLGSVIRLMGHNKLYLKNSRVVETMAGVDTVVFDKTGTLTSSDRSTVAFEGEPLSDHEKVLIRSLTCHSSHPLSRQIDSELSDYEIIPIHDFVETVGQGIKATINSQKIMIGSALFVGREKPETSIGRIYVSFDGHIRGWYAVGHAYRDGLEKLAGELGTDFGLTLLSGDNDREKIFLSTLFGEKLHFLFEQSPHDKLKYVADLKQSGKTVLMVGDGLNDAGALGAANIGVAVTDDISSFSPACDGILEGKALNDIAKLLRLARASLSVIKMSFLLSFLYNIIGIAFAVSGLLSPLFCAILMPLSSISVVAFATLTTTIWSKRIGLV